MDPGPPSKSHQNHTFELKNTQILNNTFDLIDVDDWGPNVVYVLTSVTSAPLQQVSKSAKQHLE